jgi:hypothetical protein
MTTKKEDQKSKNPTKIGDKLKWKNSILGQSFNKKKSQLHNGKNIYYSG